MARSKREPGARCERDYVAITPASVIVMGGIVGGTTEIAVPEMRTEYSAGQIVRFGSIKRAKAFIGAHPAGTFSFVPAGVS